MSLGQQILVRGGGLASSQLQNKAALIWTTKKHVPQLEDTMYVKLRALFLGKCGLDSV